MAKKKKSKSVGFPDTDDDDDETPRGGALSMTGIDRQLAGGGGAKGWGDDDADGADAGASSTGASSGGDDENRRSGKKKKKKSKKKAGKGKKSKKGKKAAKYELSASSGGDDDDGAGGGRAGKQKKKSKKGKKGRSKSPSKKKAAKGKGAKKRKKKKGASAGGVTFADGTVAGAFAQTRYRADGTVLRDEDGLRTLATTSRGWTDDAPGNDGWAGTLGSGTVAAAAARGSGYTASGLSALTSGGWKRDLYSAIVNGDAEEAAALLRAQDHPVNDPLFHARLDGSGPGASRRMAFDRGATALHVAAWAGQTAVVRLLLGMGADPSVQDGLAQTPLEVATSKKVKGLLSGRHVEHDVHCRLERVEGDLEDGLLRMGDQVMLKLARMQGKLRELGAEGRDALLKGLGISAAQLEELRRNVANTAQRVGQLEDLWLEAGPKLDKMVTDEDLEDVFLQMQKMQERMDMLMRENERLRRGCCANSCCTIC